MLGLRRFRTSLVMVAAASFVLTACGGDADEPGSASGEPETVKIAAPMPLSGPAAAYGQSYMKSLEIIVDKINADGGIKSLDGAKIEILSGDDEGNPERAPEMLRSMIDEGAVAAVGPIPSASVLVSLTVLDELQVPMVSPSLDATLSEQGSEFFFRMVQPTNVWAEQGVAFLEEQVDAGGIELEKVGVVTMNVPPGTGARDGLLASLDDMGVETVDIQYDPKTTKDYGPIIAQLREADVDLVTGHMGPGETGLFAAALQLQDWRPTNGFLWVSGGVAVNGGVTAAGPTGTNWMLVDYAGTTSKNPVTTALSEEYTAATDESIDAMSSSAATCIGALVAALEVAGQADGVALRDALRELSYESPDNYLTYAGGVKFNEVGDNTEFQSVITQIDAEGNKATIYPADAAVAEPHWPAHDKG